MRYLFAFSEIDNTQECLIAQTYDPGSKTAGFPVRLEMKGCHILLLQDFEKGGLLAGMGRNELLIGGCRPEQNLQLLHRFFFEDFQAYCSHYQYFDENQPLEYLRVLRSEEGLRQQAYQNGSPTEKPLPSCSMAEEEAQHARKLLLMPQGQKAPTENLFQSVCRVQWSHEAVTFAYWNNKGEKSRQEVPWQE